MKSHDHDAITEAKLPILSLTRILTLMLQKYFNESWNPHPTELRISFFFPPGKKRRGGGAKKAYEQVKTGSGFTLKNQVKVWLGNKKVVADAPSSKNVFALSISGVGASADLMSY